MAYTKVTSIEELKALCAEEPRDFFICLNGGARSSKSIFWDGKKFSVYNEIDDSEDELTPDQLIDERYTNVGKAIELGAFYQY